MFRQVAHPEMLSFRPFPGGAIRIQNGSLGFMMNNNFLSLKLITASTFQKHDVKFIQFDLNQLINNSSNLDARRF